MMADQIAKKSICPEVDLGVQFQSEDWPESDDTRDLRRILLYCLVF